MTREDAEPRWLDPSSDASDELRQLLLLTEEDNPTPRELSALDARVAPLLEPAPNAPAPGAELALTEGVKGSGLLGKIVVGVGVAAVGVGSAWLATHDSPRLASDELVLPVSVPARSVELPHLTHETSRSAVPHDLTPARSGQPTRATATADPADEMELLRKAQLALRAGTPNTALQLAREHARSFPRSALGQERELIAIEALQRLGRHAEATERGERFVDRFPDSAHARRVRSILGPGPDGSAP